MKKATKIRIALIAAMLLGLEICCRTGVISQLTMVPPSAWVTGLVRLVLSGGLGADLGVTLSAVLIAIISSVCVGFLGGVVLHALPRVRRALDPFLAIYYAVPTLVFYPMFIVLFGVTDTPKIVIGFLHAVVVMITSTLNGLDRVPPVMRKSAAVFRMGRAATVFRVVLPSAAAHIFTGVKLAIAYAFVGVLGAEFILSSRGLGYDLSYAFNSFDNVRMYSLLLLVLLIVSAINAALMGWERVLRRRRGRS